ncbi:hypothetical protein [Stenotrophomonas sp.]|uniref:hypothetical protein n=1 Tax=Stenotrophomonas sp. TaxID=69392 RepID=UPI0028AB2E10|nr:hypothetical protein [Stenotrophomonas sp.]
MKARFFVVLIIGVLAAGSALAKEPIRLDASSDAAAESSWKQMIESVSAAKKQKLLLAMLQINLDGVNSAYEVVGNPELQGFGIARVKDRVAGLDADEIIELGSRTSGAEIRIQSVQ